MTENEAIKLGKKLYANITSNANNIIKTNDYIDFVRIAINALEKQIPKRPNKNFEKFSGVWCSCGKYLGKRYFVEKQSFCSNCGQKLDWSDEE